MKRFSLVAAFSMGLIVGLLLTFNTIAEEKQASVKKDEVDCRAKLVKMDKKLDAVLANQEVIFKELKRIFARIH